ncbi:MAG: FAD-dependent monooxygenase [Burkholderiaceae bacterium]
MRTAYDAIIVGGGPAGATAAALLARAGWAVALIEKQAFPRRKVCGECIAASNLPLLAAIGIDAAAFDTLAGAPLRRVALMQGARSTVFDLPAAHRAGMEWGRALGRETLDTMLIGQARAAGATLWQPWVVESLEGGPGAHRCTVHDSTSTSTSARCAVLTAPVAILANGSWEVLRAQRERRRAQRRPSDLFAFKANFREAALPPGLLPVLSFSGGYGGMVVADAGITTLACCVRSDRLDRLRRASPGRPAGEVVEALLRRECRGVDDALRTAVRDGPWLASGPLDPGVRVRGDDQVFRIGNAAGEAHPIIGEGMSMAMQSAWLLCAHLLASAPGASAESDRIGPAEPAALWQRGVARRYASAWRHHFAARLRLAAVFAHAAMRPHLSAPLLHAARRWPAIVTRGARWCGKIRTVPDAATIASLTPRAGAPRDLPGPAQAHPAGASALPSST